MGWGDALDGGNKSFDAGQLELRYVEMKNSEKTHSKIFFNEMKGG